MPVPENGEGAMKMGVCGQLAREEREVVHS